MILAGCKRVLSSWLCVSPTVMAHVMKGQSSVNTNGVLLGSLLVFALLGAYTVVELQTAGPLSRCMSFKDVVVESPCVLQQRQPSDAPTHALMNFMWFTGWQPTTINTITTGGACANEFI